MSAVFMRPDDLDYSVVDPPVRGLLQCINRSTWARTVASCGGKACHESGTFHVIIEVKGLAGVQNLLEWLTLSQRLGSETCLGGTTIRAFAIPDAELHVQHARECHPQWFGPAQQAEWVRFELRFPTGMTVSKEETEGGIYSLELGWQALKRHLQSGKHCVLRVVESGSAHPLSARLSSTESAP